MAKIENQGTPKDRFEADQFESVAVTRDSDGNKELRPCETMRGDTTGPTETTYSKRNESRMNKPSNDDYSRN